MKRFKVKYFLDFEARSVIIKAVDFKEARHKALIYLDCNVQGFTSLHDIILMKN